MKIPSGMCHLVKRRLSLLMFCIAVWQDEGEPTGANHCGYGQKIGFGCIDFLEMQFMNQFPKVSFSHTFAKGRVTNNERVLVWHGMSDTKFFGSHLEDAVFIL